MKTQTESLKKQLDKILGFDDYLISDLKPSVWAEQNRVMTADVSNFEGPFSYDRTPYVREIVDILAYDNPVKKVAIMKGAQIGLSTGVIENGIGYLMSEAPCPILLSARDEGLVKKMMVSKIDQMIDSCGLRSLLRAPAQKLKKSKTGDTDLQKLFPGGSLDAFSMMQPGRARQISARVMFLDDFEAAKTDKDAGSAEKLFLTRTASYYDTMKVFYISTPEMKQTSNIEPIYLKGDQRKYHVPCPCCSTPIELKWQTIGKNAKRAGIVWELDDEGTIVPGSVGYICQECGDFFTDAHKYEMNLAGKWIPTAVSKETGLVSYHISALYSPPGMYDWEYYVQQWLDAQPENAATPMQAKENLKTFIQTCLGETYEERGKSLKVTKLQRNTRNYTPGIVPTNLSEDDGNGPIVLVTCACDLNGTEDDARLDYEIVAWSRSGASYSVDHGSIGTFIPRENTRKDKVDRERWTYQSVGRSVWPKMTEILNTRIPDENGQEYRIGIFGIDTGHFTQYAYGYLDELHETCEVFSVGVKGYKPDKFKPIDSNAGNYVLSKERGDLYLLDVNQMKDDIAGIIDLPWSEEDGTQQPFMFMNFPTPEQGKYTYKDYFQHYEGEKRILKTSADGKTAGYLWEKKSNSVMNHFFDCRLYNYGLKDILTDLFCKEAGLKNYEYSWINYCKILLG